MIVHRDRERLFSVLLADAIFIQLLFDFGRLGNRHARFRLFRLRRKLLVEDVLAKHDAVVANVNAGAGDEFLHFRV